MRIFAIIGLFWLSLTPVQMQTKQPAKTSTTRPKKAVIAPEPKPTPKKPSTTAIKQPLIKTPDGKTGNESAEWSKATAVSDTEDRIAAIKKFTESFPKSKRAGEGSELIVKLRAEIGNEKLAAGDIENAAKQFTFAVEESPKTIPDRLFAETLIKFSPSLYGRGARNEAIALAKLLEVKVYGDSAKLLAVANFYLSVEDGIDARRAIEAVLKAAPDSSTAFQALGLAHRVEFELEESAVAYARAVELDSTSVAAQRGLAESNRSLGKADGALKLYRGILEKEPKNIAARTGVILSLFDLHKRAEAETELAAAIKDEQGNVILYAGVAYWYASQNAGEKAVDFGQRGIAADPRFIWSHIAIARGYLVQNNLADAEKSLMIAKQYGNFPTLDYELARVRMAAGFYREAAETLDASFAVEGNKVATDLGFRVRRSAADLIELVGFERRSSIFSPRSGDDPIAAERLKSLLDFVVKLESTEAKPEAIKIAAEHFITGEDESKTFRKLFVASQMVTKNLLPEMVLTLTRDTVSGVETAISQLNAPSAVLAEELYMPRTRSAGRGEIVIVPSIPRQTLSAIVRGRIEEISGAAMLQLDRRDEAIVRFRRATSVLPADSSWWRSSTWRLASALDASAQNAEAIELYYKSYRSGPPDPIKYAVIESLYRRINGKSDGLVAKIGLNPLTVTVKEPEATTEESKSTVESAPAILPATATKLPELLPAKVDVTPTPLQVGSPENTKASEPTRTSSEVAVEKTEPSQPLISKPIDTILPDKPKELFPPVVITIAPSESKRDDVTGIKPCVLTSSEDLLSIQNSGNEIAVIIGTESDEDLTEMTGVSSSVADLAVRREEIAAVKTKAIFVVRSIAPAKGSFRVIFTLPCGKKEVSVKIS